MFCYIIIAFKGSYLNIREMYHNKKHAKRKRGTETQPHTWIGVSNNMIVSKFAPSVWTRMQALLGKRGLEEPTHADDWIR